MRDVPASSKLGIALVSMALLMLALLTFASAPASAATSRPLVKTIALGPESNPWSLATDNANNLYVLDRGRQVIERLDATGNPAPFSGSAGYISGNKLTGTPAGPFAFGGNYAGITDGLAVDRSAGPSAGNIYVTFPNGVHVFDSTGTYAGAIPGSPGANTCGVGVSPGDGSVFTGSVFGLQDRRYLAPAGDPADAIPSGAIGSDYLQCAVAADSDGAAYIGGPGGYPVIKYSAANFTEGNSNGSTTFEPAGATALTVDPSSHDLFVNTGSQVKQLTSAAVQVGASFGAFNNSQGIALTGSGGVYASNPETAIHGSIFVFGPQAQLPLVTTGASANVMPDSARIEGEIDPDSSGGVTKCEFRFGADQDYSGGSMPCEPSASLGTPLTSPTSVKADLTGLTANTGYHYRLFAENANGLVLGQDQTLTTSPAVQNVATGEATAVSKDSATLQGSYLAQGLDTHYYFEYGTTESYGQTSPAPPGNDAGSPTGQQNVDPVVITGLQGETLYHYRLVMSNSFGVTFGQDMTFTTPPAVTNLNTEAATTVTNESADLNGSFDADKYAVHYYFEYGNTTDYGQVSPMAPGNEVPAGAGNLKVAPVTISGLQPGATYHFRIVASNAVGKTLGPDQTLTTADGPAIGNLSARNVKATSAELTATIDPQMGDTTYHFEYGPTTAYGTSVPVPDEDIGAGNIGVDVSQAISGLTAGITYHFRVVAQSPYGKVASEDQTFGFYPPSCPNSRLRQETGSNGLPDCRAYELASPGNTGGATIFPLGGPSTPYATNPAHIAFAGAFGRVPGSGDPINSGGDLYVATRTSSGWYTKYIGLAANETLEMGGPPESWRRPVADHGPTEGQVGVLSSLTMDRILNYNDEPPGFNAGDSAPPPSNAPYVWDSSTNTQVARWPSNLSEVEHGAEFIGTPTASADFSHFVFSSDTVFAQGGEAVTIPRRDYSNFFNLPCCAGPVYDNNTVTGDVTHISVKEDKKTNFIGLPIKVSDDGNYIVMSEGAEPSMNRESPLFVWVNAVGHTYDIAPGHSVRFEGATADGKTVYLSSTEQLTADDHDASRDLFMWQASNPNALTRISVGLGGGAGDSDGCSVSWTTGCGTVVISTKSYSGLSYFPSSSFVGNGQNGNGVTDSPIASKSGDIYFESPEQLDGAKGEAGQVNLYVYRDGEVHFVTKMNFTTLCSGTFAEVFCSEGPVARMQVTPDGKYAGFITPSRVTSYDNAGKAEMYRYSADSGQVICVSCPPSGQPPTVDVYGSQNGLFLIDDGRMGFSTNDALVPHDTDETNDTYEYVEGRPQLISSGLGPPHNYQGGYDEGKTTSGLVGMSANGVDFYFASYDHLVTQDHNGQEVKIYDARTNGGFPAEVPPANCQAADECHGPGSTPPAPMADRTSASQGAPVRAKAKKHKKQAKHQKKKRARHNKQKRAAKNRSGR